MNNLQSYRPRHQNPKLNFQTSVTRGTWIFQAPRPLRKMTFNFHVGCRAPVPKQLSFYPQSLSKSTVPQNARVLVNGTYTIPALNLGGPSTLTARHSDPKPPPPSGNLDSCGKNCHDLAVGSYTGLPPSLLFLSCSLARSLARSLSLSLSLSLHFYLSLPSHAQREKHIYIYIYIYIYLFIYLHTGMCVYIYTHE